MMVSVSTAVAHKIMTDYAAGFKFPRLVLIQFLLTVVCGINLIKELSINFEK